MKKKICILGSTGSIGKTTLQILSQNKKDFEALAVQALDYVQKLKPKK